MSVRLTTIFWSRIEEKMDEIGASFGHFLDDEAKYSIRGYFWQLLEYR
jgi:hypothetical protein